MNNEYYTLQGDKLEAFYQFGLAEKNKKSSSKIIKEIVFKNKIFSYISEKILGNTLQFPDFLKDEMYQYIEGKGLRHDEFIQNFYLPEVVSAINSISPNSVPNIGCSSGLVNDGKSIKHLRILDYPLGPNSDEYSSNLLFNLEGLNKTFSFSFNDIPLPALTSVNEYGISSALHQKVSPNINFKGSSIFELTSRIALQTKSIDEAIVLANDFNSINRWSIILVSKEEKLGIEIETSPEEKPNIKKYDLSNKVFSYVCNKALKNFDSDKKSFTGTWDFYNNKRENWLNELNEEEKVEHFFKLPKVLSKTPFSHYTITPASIQSLEINLTENNVTKLSKSGVKYHDGQSQNFHIDWSKANSKVENHLRKAKRKSSIEIFYESVSSCQFYWDQGDQNKAFHYAQKCLEHAPSNDLKSVANIFYSYFLFCELSNEKVLSRQYRELLTYLKKAPKFIQQDCLLLINYYAFYLGFPTNDLDNLIPSHLQHFEKNTKIPKFLFKKVFKYLYVARFELFSFGKVNYLIDAVASP